MKKILYFLAAALVAFTSCGKDNLEPDNETDDPQRTPRLEVTSDNGLFVQEGESASASVNFKTKGGEVIINVSTNLDGWTYECAGGEWLNIEADKHFITLSAPLNEETSQRKATLTIVASDAADAKSEYVVNITQNWAGQPEINLSANAVRFPAFGDLSSEITLETSADDITFDCTCQWLLIERTEGGYKFSANPNEGNDQRTVDVKFKAGTGKDAAEEVVRISQDGKAWFEISSTVAHADGNGAVSVIEYKSNPELAIVFTPEEGASWYSVTAEDGKLSVSISPNADNKQRDSEIKILVGEKENVREGKIRVLQIGEDTEELIFEVRINEDGNKLSTAGASVTTRNSDMDITVDWGDGSEPEHYVGNAVRPSHIYSKAGVYIVTTKGKAPTYDFSDLSGHAIEDGSWQFNILNILSWGKFGVQEAKYVCKTSKSLKSIPADVCGSFADVKDFTGFLTFCQSLEEIPDDLFKYAVNATTFQDAFSNIKSCKAIPETLFANCPNATDFSYAFREFGVGDLINGGDKVSEGNRIVIPENLFANCPNVTKFTQTFRGMNIATVPENLFANNTAVTSFNGLFTECTELETIPADLFKNNQKATDFKWLFYGSHVRNLPVGLFKHIPSGVTVYINQMFQNATIDDFPVGFFEGLDGAKVVMELFESATFTKGLKPGMLKGLVNATSADRMFYRVMVEELPSGLFEGFAENSATVDMSKVFFGCEKLTSIPADIFDPVADKATKFADTFRQCTSLKSIPEGFCNACTKVTSITNLFYGCTALEKIPSEMFRGSAAKLATCSFVFQGCTSLTEVPDGLFSFITARNANFGNCFNSCTGLKKVGAEVFPATTAVAGLGSTFKGCTALTDISADVIAKCTALTGLSMTFQNCTALERVPAGLFAHQANITSFDQTFSGCTALTTVPEGLFDTCVKVTNMSKLFYGCSALKSVPATIFAKNVKVNNFSNLFYGCTSLESIPAGLFSTNTAASNFSSAFVGCQKVKSIPADLFAKCTVATNFSYAFQATSIEEIPAELFSNVPSNNTSVNFNYCFAECTSLKTIPTGLFDTAKKASYFNYCFAACTALTGESPFTNVDGTKVHLYERKALYQLGFNNRITGTNCFYNCTGLSDYDKIPSAWGGGAK